MYTWLLEDITGSNVRGRVFMAHFVHTPALLAIHTAARTLISKTTVNIVITINGLTEHILIIN